MVPRTGVEPVTCPLGGGRAIHLCHRGKPNNDYSFFALADQSIPPMLRFGSYFLAARQYANAKNPLELFKVP